MLISELYRHEKVIGIYGLAKNTGKTVTLNVFIEELYAQGDIVGITSIGRDGEKCDAINQSISKPQISAPGGTIVATTHCLLKKCGHPYLILEKTPYKIPLGKVVVAKLISDGKFEIAGPSSRDQVKHVADIMLTHGASKVIVDGAINRRSASSPDVTDSIIIATGAALDKSIDKVVQETKDAIDRVNIPEISDDSIKTNAFKNRFSYLITSKGHNIYLNESFALTERLSYLLKTNETFGEITHIVIWGAACEVFLDSVLAYTKGRDIYVIVSDSSKIYLENRSIQWYEQQSIFIRVLQKTTLRMITVNPVSPLSHRFDSNELIQKLSVRLPKIKVVDVMQNSYKMHQGSNVQFRQ